MSYLKCRKCGGYYELKKGEKASDFKTCECGGTLEEIKSIDTEPLTCPKCGFKNPENTKYCGSCGLKLEDKPFLERIKLNYVLTGTLITFITFIITTLLYADVSFNSYQQSAVYITIYFLIILIGPIFAGILNKTDYKSSAIQGSLIMFFPLMYFLLLAYTTFSPFFGYDYSGVYSIVFILVALGIFIVYMVLAALGSILGTYLQSKLDITEKNWWIDVNETLNQIESSQLKVSYLTFVVTFILLSIWSLVV